MMLSKTQMMKLALDECVDMIGKDLVEAHKELCCCSCYTTDKGLFSYALGMDTKLKNLPIGDETPMRFYAYVIVDPTTGKVTKDYKKSTLPN